MERNTIARLVCLALVTAGFAVFALPKASAHTCASYSDTCNPDGCKEGEDHDHTRYHWIGEDEHCESHKKDPEPSCKGSLIERLICVIIGPSDLTDELAASLA